MDSSTLAEGIVGDKRLVVAGTGSVGKVEHVLLVQVFVREEFPSLDSDGMGDENEGSDTYLARRLDQALA